MIDWLIGDGEACMEEAIERLQELRDHYVNDLGTDPRDIDRLIEDMRVWLGHARKV